MYSEQHEGDECLFHIPGARVYDVIGDEEPISGGAPPPLKTVSIVRVSNGTGGNGGFTDHFSKKSSVSGHDDQKSNYHLNITVEGGCSLDLPSTTRIRRDRPRRYRIPRCDMGPDSGIYLVIDFALPGSTTDGFDYKDSKVDPAQKYASSSDIEMFESIVDQSVILEETGSYTAAYEPLPAYNPGDNRWVADEKGGHGRILLVDDESAGNVIGELAEGAEFVEAPGLPHDTDHAVEIQISADGKRVEVRPITEDYLNMARHPAYKNSTLVQNAAAASRLIVTTSTTLGRMLSQGAENFTQKTKPNEKPMTFSPTTHEGVKKVHTFTSGAATISAKTLGSVSKYAQNFGAHMSGRTKKDKHYDERGEPIDTYKPGIVHKGMVAFSTIADGIATSGKHLLTSGGSAASTVVGHKFGPEAGSIATGIAGGIKNVGLVYIDATGISHRAIIKSVAKGAVVGKIKGGGNVVVGGVDGGVVTEEELKAAEAHNGSSSQAGHDTPLPPYSAAAGPSHNQSYSGNRPESMLDDKSTYGERKGEKYG